MVLWTIAVVFSVTSFWFIWSELPSVGDVVIGHTVYTLLSLPVSFLEMPMSIAGSNAQNIKGVWFLALLFSYWGVTLFLHWKYIKSGSVLTLIALAANLLLSSFKWLYFSMGMAGI